MIYLTVNDLPSGVYESQVIDVVKYMQTLDKSAVRLISFVPVKAYFKSRRQLKNLDSSIKVYPMFPGLKNWKKTKLILSFIRGIRSERIVARGPMAAYLALQLNQNVVYDGRAAVKAELIEFPNIVLDKNLVNDLIKAERISVQSASFRIAVSNALVEYWKAEFKYEGENHVIIPCTISSKQLDSCVELSRKEIGFDEKDIILIYSGGSAEWQSFTSLMPRLENWISDQGVKIIFLSRENSPLLELQAKFPENIRVTWVKHDEVVSYLNVADYGLLIRDKNITNRVSSPVKFAEYLNAGLKVLISPELGDFTNLVKEHNLGEVVDQSPVRLSAVEIDDKFRIKRFAQENLRKENFRSQYEQLF